MRAAVAIGAIVVLVGCSSAARPVARTPSDPVRDEITRAEAAEKLRRHDVARVHYERAVASAHDPTSIAFARREFAETLITWGELDEARTQLERVVVARVDDAAAWHDLGILRHNRGDAPGAVVALTHARDLAPKDPRPRVALAALRWKSGDRAGAATEYRALLELELPDRLRTKVQWALGELAKP
ncbi:MAG: tetratricopeptide repeat protein [Kofleriaceae bacterium]